METDLDSRYVNPSQVLDCMLTDETRPDVVISWLDDLGQRFPDVIAGSLHWPKIFQLDFFIGLRQPKHMEWVLGRLPKLALLRATLPWQILASKTKAADFLKYAFEKRLYGVIDSVGLRHPYAAGHGKHVNEADAVLDELSATGRVADFPALAGEKAFANYMYGIEHSLFFTRIAQADVFAACTDIQKWCMLSRIAQHNVSLAWSYAGGTSAVLYFFLQILASGEDDEVKLECYRRMFGRAVFNAPLAATDTYSASLNKKIDLTHAKSVQELLVEADVSGDAVGLQTAVALLRTRPKWIVDWVQCDPEGLDRILPVSGFVSANAAEILEIHRKANA